MLRDPELGKNFPGKEIVSKFLEEKMHIFYWSRRGGNEGNVRRNDLQEENC